MSADKLTREGELGELMVRADLFKQSLTPMVPDTASCPFDLGAYDPQTGKIFKVQVKSYKHHNKMLAVPLQNRKNSTVARHGRGKTHTYKLLVDYMAIHVKQTGEIFYIPSSELPDDGTSATFLLPEYDGRSKKPRLGEQHRRLQ